MPKGKSLFVDMRKLIVDNNKLQSGERQSDISKTISLCNQRRSLVNILKSGRPRKTDKTTDRKIGMVSRQNPFWNAVKIQKEIPNVRSSLLDVDLMKLDFMEENQQRNRSFLLKIEKPGYSLQKDYLNWTPRQWKNILFSDETKFNLCSSDGIQ
jgi:hypothetical protein